MASNKIVRLGPLALTTSVANIWNPNATSGGVGMGTPNTYLVIRHIRIVNKTSSAATATLYIGATGGSAAGTEFGFNATSIPANSYVDWYGQVRLDAADFLTGLAGTGTALTITAEGEAGIA